MAVCFDLLFTFPLVFSPAREVIENSILHRSTGWMNTKRNIIRTVLVIMTFGVAQVRLGRRPFRLHAHALMSKDSDL